MGSVMAAGGHCSTAEGRWLAWVRRSPLAWTAGTCWRRLGGSALGVGSGGGRLLTLVGASRSQLGGPSGSCFLWRRVGHWRASYACRPYWRCEAVGVGGGVPFAACIAVERLLALSACGCSGLGLALAAGVNHSVLLALAGSVTFAVCVDRRLALL